MKDKILDIKISGWGIFAFRQLTEIKLAELRSEEEVNEFYEPLTENISRRFYINKLNSIGIFDTIRGSLKLRHLEKINKLRKHYVEFRVHYSLNSRTEIENELLYNQKYEYVVLYYFEDLIDSYNRTKNQFYKKSGGKNYIKVRYIPEILSPLKYEEIGSFSDLIKERIGN